MNYHRVLTNDVNNGIGVRVVLFVSGCIHHCEGCHNPQTWDFHSGRKFGLESQDAIVNALKNPHIDGLTLTGGDPLAPPNRNETFLIARNVKRMGKSVWAYTGYLWEEVKDLPIMEFLDVLVDGRFDKDKRDITLLFRGSSNQRIIDVQKTRESGVVSLWEEPLK